MGVVSIDEIIEDFTKEKIDIKNDYISIEETVLVELDIKKSRFIGMAFHVESDNDVHQIIGNLRKSNKNASHVCYAYILGENMSVAKNNDDGEPAGSAGVPIYEAIKQAYVTNTLVAVIRYFGGAELGKGRLTRAYNAIANAAITEAKKFKMVYCNEIEIKVPYTNYGSVSKLFTDSNVHIIEQKNDESMPSVKLAVPVKASDKVLEGIRSKTRGSSIINKYGTGFYKFEYKTPTANGRGEK